MIKIIAIIFLTLISCKSNNPQKNKSNNILKDTISIELDEIFKDAIKYNTYDYGCNYELLIVEDSDERLHYKFSIERNDTFLLTLRDTAYLKSKELNERQDKYGVTAYGRSYFSRTNGFKTYIQFENSSSKFVSFYHDIDYIKDENGKELKELKNLRELTMHVPFLLREDSEDEYKIKISHLIRRYSTSRHRLKENLADENSKKRLAYYSDNFMNLISRLKTSNNSKDVLADTTIFDELNYYGLYYFRDELIKIGLIGRCLVPDTEIQIVDKDSINNLFAIVRSSFIGEVLGNRFEKYFFSNTSLFYKNYWFDNYKALPLCYSYFFIEDTNFMKIDDKYLMIMREPGHEQRFHIFTIWDDMGQFYQLNSILDSSYNVGIGRASIDTIMTVGENKHIVIGNNFSADGEYAQNEFWVGQITDYRRFNQLYSNKVNSDLEKAEYHDYYLDEKNNFIILNSYISTGYQSKRDDKLIMTDTIRYLDLKK